jgi:hypothetical protein
VQRGVPAPAGGLIISSGDYGGAPGASPHASHAHASVCTADCHSAYCASLNALQRSLQAPDDRGVHVVGPRYIRLCVARRKSCNRFLPLIEFEAALLRSFASLASAGTYIPPS